MKFYHSLFLLICSFFAYSQDIIKDVAKKPGIYEDFKSFRTNSPSLEGEIEFVRKNNGKVTRFLINGDSLTNNQISRYWGFCKDNLVFINALRDWYETGSTLTPKLSFYPLVSLGYYSYALIETNNMTAAAVLGGAVGGLIGGVIAASFATPNSKIKSLPVNQLESEYYENRIILTVNHSTGYRKVVDQNTMLFILLDEVDLLNKFEKETTYSTQMMVEYLDRYNEIKVNKKELVFDIKEFWPTLFIARKNGKQENNKINITVNDIQIGALDLKSQIEEKVPMSGVNIVFTTDSNDAKAELFLDLDQKEKKFIVVSNNQKNPSKITVKEIDATRMRYLMESKK